MKWVKSAWLTIRSRKSEADVSERIFRNLVLAIAFLFCVFSVVYALNGAPKVAALQLMVTVVCLISLWIHRKTSSTALAASFILLFSVPSVFYRASYLGATASPAFHVFPVVSILTMAVLPPFWALFWSALYAAMAVYFHVSERMGVLYPVSIPPEKISAIRVTIVILVQIICLYVMYYIKKANRLYRQQAVEKSHEKANLLRILSHDLATPLMILIHNADRLEERFGDQKELRAFRSAVQVIQSLITGVRELEAVDSGKREIRLQPTSLLACAREIVEIQREGPYSKQISLQLHRDSETDAYEILADPRSLAYQVINNLVSNSLKFTHPGGRIDITLRRIEDTIEFEILDNGVGIAAERLRHLFEPDRPTSSFGTSGERGTGFGLPIVKSYVGRFGGTIEIESAIKNSASNEHGTRVTLRFPALQGM